MSWINVGMTTAGAVKGIAGAKKNKQKQKQMDAFRKTSIAMSPWSGLGDPGAMNAGNQDILGGAVGGGMQGLMLAQTGTKAMEGLKGLGAKDLAKDVVKPNVNASAGALGGGPPMAPPPQAPPMLQSNEVYAANQAGSMAPPPGAGGNDLMASLQQGTPMAPSFGSQPINLNQQMQAMGGGVMDPLKKMGGVFNVGNPLAMNTPRGGY